MLNHWFHEIPSDPLHDLQKVSGVVNKEHVNKIINGIDTRSNRPLHWNPLQVVLTWTDRVQMMLVLEELVLMGADINGLGLCGLNPLHIIILLLFFRKNRNDAILLEWWMSKGVDVHKYSVLFDIRQKKYRILSPLDMIVGLSSNTLSINPSVYLPAHCSPRKKPFANKRGLGKLLGLFLCYGATSSEPCPLLDEIKASWTSTMPFSTVDYLHDYVKVRFKLPLELKGNDIRNRLRFLQRYAPHVDHDEIVRHRKRRWEEEAATYSNPNFEDAAEFMPYEYVGYRDPRNKQYNFHKTMVPSILQSKVNPFTRENIPAPVLRQWFHELSQRPYTFQQLCILREVVLTDGLVMWDKNDASEDLRNNFALHFIHAVLYHNFPYTNILHVVTLSPPKIVYLCHALSQEPYLLTHYVPCPHSHPLSYFAERTISYIMKDTFPIDVLHFGVEDGLQDISCHDLVKTILDKSTLTFQDSFLNVIMTLPEVGDVIRDRLGYVHLGYFQEIWQRLVAIHNNFC